jgi:hypothetical protein
VAIELVEAKLVKALPEIFSPITVCTMPPELVSRIAGEPDEKLRRREELEKQFAALGKGSEICKRFAGMKLIGETYRPCVGACSKERVADIVADKIVDGAGGPASVDEPIREDEVADADEPSSEGAPASEVDSLQPHDQSEVDFNQFFTTQPPPVEPIPRLPSPQFHFGG